MTRRSALIFADGKLGVGLGHISRCRALKAELESLDFEVRLLDTQEIGENLGRMMYDLVVIDSYVLPLESYEYATKNARVCLFFDDTLRLPYPEAILLNNAINADLVQYQEKYPKHQLLLGSDYRLLQSPFVEALKSPVIPLRKEIQRVLITLGGEDVLSLSQPLFAAIKKAYPALELHCITKESMLAEQGAKLHFDLSAQEMVDLISQMDICICACGQSLSEILACGIPVIALEVAENQNANLKSFSTCILNVPQAYLPSCDLICHKVLEHLESLTSLTLRTTNQARALEILSRPTKWKESLRKIFDELNCSK